MASNICFTVSDLKTALGITGTTFDARFSSILDGVSASIRKFLNYDPAESELVEYLSTKGGVEAQLRRHPVTAVASLYLDESGRFGQNPDGFPASSLLTVGTGYTWTPGGTIQLANRLWPYSIRRGINRLSDTLDFARGAVKVTYTIDNTDVMAVAKEAGLLEGAARWMVRPGLGGVMSEQIDGYAVTVSPVQHLASDSSHKLISPAAHALLLPFRITPLV